jgi:hypothetical protein
MAAETNRSCKCPFTCKRHGDCSACKEYHLKDNSKTYCVKSSYEKEIDRNQAALIKLTSGLSKIPGFNMDTIKEITSFQKFFKNVTVPTGIGDFADKAKDITNVSKRLNKSLFPDVQKMAGIEYFVNKMKDITDVVNQAKKALLPDIQRFFGIALEIERIFEKQRQSQYNFKQEIIEKWKKLDTELKTENRYFPKSDLLLIFEKCIEDAKYTLLKGKHLFRARIIELDEFSKNVDSIIKKATEQFNDYEYQKTDNKARDVWEYIENISKDEWEENYQNSLRIPKIKFWGFNSKQSDAPPGSKTIPGRANPVGISYLYASDSIITAISEAQPSINQLISVAKIKILKNLKLFNFNFYDAFNDDFLDKSLMEIKEKIGLSFENIKIFFDTISELFSKPSLGRSDNYFATQYISEFIKNHGFDGILFNSSLKKQGKNIVLFHTTKSNKDNKNNYRILSSSLHKIDDISVSVRSIFPNNLRNQ